MTARRIHFPAVRTKGEADEWAESLTKLLPRVEKVEVIRLSTDRWQVVATMAPSRFADWTEGSLEIVEEVNENDETEGA